MNSMNNDFVNRKYRRYQRGQDLVHFQVKVKQTDLFIGVTKERYNQQLAAEIEQRVYRVRAGLETYIASHPEFLTSLEPVTLKPGAPEIARRMARAAVLAGVGPMAAVAGAFAEEVGEVLTDCPDVIVENSYEICNGAGLFLRGPAALTDRYAGTKRRIFYAQSSIHVQYGHVRAAVKHRCYCPQCIQC
jgi:hypothetical protein